VLFIVSWETGAVFIHGGWNAKAQNQQGSGETLFENRKGKDPSPEGVFQPHSDE
jgi:hypothetical protein